MTFSWLPASVRRRCTDAERRRADAGFTLIEMMVTMTLLVIVLSIFGAGIVAAFTTTNLSKHTATAQTQANLAFLRLDREIRYATSLSTPGAVGGNYYAEFLTNTATGPTCTQLRVNTAAGQLSERTWPADAAIISPSGWNVLASGVSATQPFTVLPADNTYNYQRLTIDLTTTAGTGSTVRVRNLSSTFVAADSASAANNPSICTGARSQA